MLVQADVTGLSPGGHGFHIHAVGACEPDFSAAGDHFIPEGIGHGFMKEGGWHAGDLPNSYAAADGTARADFFTAAVTLTPDAENSIFDADGSAIIVHAKPDSYGESPGAGDRVACGVIRPGEPEPAGNGCSRRGCSRRLGRQRHDRARRRRGRAQRGPPGRLRGNPTAIQLHHRSGMDAGTRTREETFTAALAAPLGELGAIAARLSRRHM